MPHTIDASLPASQIELAEAYYTHQLGERTTSMPTQIDRLSAAWPCFFGEVAVGDMRTGSDGRFRLQHS